MMTLSMIAGLVASLVVASLMWDTLPLLGAEVEPISVEQRLRLFYDWVF